MKVACSVFLFVLLSSSLAWLPTSVSAQNWTTLSYPNFNSRNEFAWRSLDKDYIDVWQAKIYNHLTYNNSYSDIYGAEVGFYNRSNREVGTVGVAISFTKTGNVDVLWFDGTGSAITIASGYWSTEEATLVTITNGHLSVGDTNDPENIIKSYFCGAWTMNQVGAKGDVGLTNGGYISLTIDSVPALENWKPLNADPDFNVPSKDQYYYNSHVSPSGVSNETISAAGGFAYIKFSSGKMTMNISNPLSGENQFGTLVAGVFHESAQNWFYQEGDKRIPSTHRIKVNITVKVLNVSNQAEWLRAGVAVGFTLNNELQRFVELDFFRKNKPVGVDGSEEVVVVPFANVSVGERVSLELDMTRDLEKYLDEWFHLKGEEYKVWGVWLALETINSTMALEVNEFQVLYSPKEEIYRYAFVNDWDFNIPLDDVANRKWKDVGWVREERIEGFANIANGKAKLKINTLSKTTVDTVALAQGNEPHQGVNVISKLLASNTNLEEADEVTQVVIRKNDTSSWSDYYFLYSMCQLTKRNFTATEGIMSAWNASPGFTLGFGLECQHEYYDPLDDKYHVSDYWNMNMQLGSKGEPWLAAATYTDVLMVGEYYNPSSERWEIWRGPGTGQFSADYTDTMSVQYHGLGGIADVGVWYTLQVNLTRYRDKIFSDVQAYWNSCAQALGRLPSQHPVLTSLVLRQYVLYLEGTAVDVAADVEYVKMENSIGEYEFSLLQRNFSDLAEEVIELSTKLEDLAERTDDMNVSINELKENVTQLSQTLSRLQNEFNGLVFILTAIVAISIITTLYYVVRTRRRIVSDK